MKVFKAATFCFLQVLVIHTAEGIYNLNILHTNDVHARYEQINKYGGACSVEDAADKKCYGGVARMLTEINEIRNDYPNTLLLDAGDQFQGTLFYYQYKGMDAAILMQALGYQAMALGNHEFDGGATALATFLNNVTFPVLSSNLNATLEPLLDNLIAPSAKVTIGNQTIGIIGYLTKYMPQLTQPDNIKDLIFEDEVKSVQKEVNNLMADGINKIIALGHAGYQTDIDIAERVRGVDVVVGGHTNTFLYTGDEPSNEKPEGLYPKVVTQASGKQVLVVQDYSFGKYLGFLSLTFDDNGEIMSWEGNPILLNGSIEEDADLKSQVQSMAKAFTSLTKEKIGFSNVFLDGTRDTCRTGECNLGNLVTDAMVAHFVQPPTDMGWTKAAVAMINSGAIRNNIESGPVSIGAIKTAFPFRDTVSMFSMTGQYLLEILELSAIHMSTPSGGVLQFSGMKIAYDLSRPENKRVIKVEVRCSNCTVSKYETLQMDNVYNLLSNDFVISGGDGYSMIKSNLIQYGYTGDLVEDILRNYIAKMSPVTTGLYGTIQYQDSVSKPPTGKDNTCGASGIAALSILQMFLMICVISGGYW